MDFQPAETHNVFCLFFSRVSVVTLARLALPELLVPLVLLAPLVQLANRETEERMWVHKLKKSNFQYYKQCIFWIQECMTFASRGQKHKSVIYLLLAWQLLPPLFKSPMMTILITSILTLLVKISQLYLWINVWSHISIYKTLLIVLIKTH